MLEYISNSVEKTKEFGKKIGKFLFVNSVVGLFGGLATGKTVLTKGILMGMGVVDTKVVTSPSFIIIKQYRVADITVYHFDLYRVANIIEIEELGWDEFFNSDSICIIEWAQKAKEIMPKNYLGIELYIENRNSRRLCVIPKGRKYDDIVEKLKPRAFSNQKPELKN